MEYHARRAAIAEVAEFYRRPDPIPDVEYSPEEDHVWHIVSSELAAKHEESRVPCLPGFRQTPRAAGRPCSPICERWTSASPRLPAFT